MMMIIPHLITMTILLLMIIPKLPIKLMNRLLMLISKIVDPKIPCYINLKYKMNKSN